MRTAQAFGTQGVLSRLYDVNITKSKEADLTAAAWHGGGLAIFFFVIYSSYALCESTAIDRAARPLTYSRRIAFNFGTTLINQGHGMAHIELHLARASSLIVNMFCS